MFPGLTTKVSEMNVAAAATIIQKADVLRVTDTTSTTQISTITPGAGGFSVVCFLQNKSGAAITIATNGNVTGGATFTINSNEMAVLIFSKLEGKWSITHRGT